MFRSQVAESIFKKLNKNKKYNSDSAGVIKGDHPHDGTITALKEIGINIKKFRQI